MLKIFTIAHVPSELGQTWLQHLREFEAAHPECYFEIGLNTPYLTFAERIKLRITRRRQRQRFRSFTKGIGS
jgi:hypothetical protein